MANIETITLQPVDSDDTWDPNGPYFDTFWLPILGATAVAFQRFAVFHCHHPGEHQQHQWTVDELNARFGLVGGARGTGANAPLPKAIRRLFRYDLIDMRGRHDAHWELTIPSKVPSVPPKVRKQWTSSLAAEHAKLEAFIALADSDQPGPST